MNSFSINGVTFLTLASFFGKIFGAIYRIPLSNLLGANGMGIYQMAFPMYSFFLTFITGGVSVYLSKTVARLRAKNGYITIYKKYAIAKRITFVFGIFITLFLIVFSMPIAYIQGNKNAYLGFIFISFGFIFASMLGAYRGYYQGFNNMKPTAISQIIEQAGKLIFGLFLTTIFLRYGIVYGVCGALLGVSVSEMLSLVYFLIINRKIKKEKVRLIREDYFSTIKEFLPISFSYGVMPLSVMIDSFLIINLLSINFPLIATDIYGIETGMILPLINIPNVIISAIAIALIPSISYKIEKGEDVSLLVNKIFKIVFILVIPCALGMFVLSNSIITILYSNLGAVNIALASNLLMLSVLEMFFLCFMGISNAVLQALGKAELPLKSLTFGLIIKLIVEVILVPIAFINIFGLVIASILGYGAICIINIIKIRNITGFSIQIKDFLTVFLSSCLMLLFIFVLTIFKQRFGLYVYLSSVVLGSVIIYFITLWLFGTLKINTFKKVLQNDEV